MDRRSFVSRTAIAVVALALVPAAAWAGKQVTAGGDQRLQLSVSVQPNRAGVRITKLHLRVEYTNSTGNGQQPPVNGAATVFKLPKGTTFHFAAAHACKESDALKAPSSATPCPPSTKLGSGSVVVNARPTIGALIHGQVTEFYGIDDSGVGGYAKGSPVLVLYVKTAIGVNQTDFFHVVKAGQTLELIGRATKPSHRGIGPGDTTLQTLDLTSGASPAAYFGNPATCAGRWRSALTLTNFFGQPPITATDAERCRS